MKGIYFAYAMMWVAVSVAVSIGLYFTRNIHCLWFLIIPLFVSVKHEPKDKSNPYSEGEEKRKWVQDGNILRQL